MLRAGDYMRVEEIGANYSEGKSVTAYYDPDEPSNAYLIEDRNVLLPVGLAGFGMLTAFLSLRGPVRRLTGLAT